MRKSADVDDKTNTKKRQSTDELSVVPRYLFTSLHGSSQLEGSEVQHGFYFFIGIWRAMERRINIFPSQGKYQFVCELIEISSAFDTKIELFYMVSQRFKTF
jgi:hypothetical protein